MKKVIIHSFIILIIIISCVKKGIAQTVLLYQNSFELPLITPAANCGPDLDATFVNTLWGGTGAGTGGGGFFQQEFTVETILINGPNNQYTDLSSLGGNYCLSMLSVLQDDKLALTLNSQMLPFANISFLISPIDLPACGGPLGLDTAIMHLSVYDSPGGTFSFASPGTLLDEDTVIGSVPGLTPFTFNWLEASSSLDIINSVDGNITIVFNLIKSGYAAIDSIIITSSVVPTSIHEQNEIDRIVAFPNPFTNQVEVNGTSIAGELTLLDARGKTIHFQKTFASKTILNTEDLASGIYFINYIANGRVKSSKLVKF